MHIIPPSHSIKVTPGAKKRARLSREKGTEKALRRMWTDKRGEEGNYVNIYVWLWYVKHSWGRQKVSPFSCKRFPKVRRIWRRARFYVHKLISIFLRSSILFDVMSSGETSSPFTALKKRKNFEQENVFLVVDAEESRLDVGRSKSSFGVYSDGKLFTFNKAHKYFSCT